MNLRHQSPKHRSDLARAQWHQLVLSIIAAKRALLGLGHHAEAEYIGTYVNLFSRLGAQHCERIERGQDSTLSASDDSGRTSAPAGETSGARTGCCADVGAAPHMPNEQDTAPGPPISDVVSIPVTNVVQRRIEELSPREAEDQRYEVALKFLYRARAVLDGATDDKGRPTNNEDKMQLAWKLVHASQNVLEGGANADVG